ncbi:MAG: HvfC/BufC family peptide modification chaperone [Methylocella sp.]
MKLAELQLRFQAGIVEGDQSILALIADSRRTDRATLFAVYHDAYRMRLAEFLSNDFPIVRVHLGEEAFGRLVEDYIESAPSRQPNARWYGTRLPDFMQETAPWRTNRSAIDLARFERALSDAFDASDAPIAILDALRDIRVEDWPRLAFEFHPSVRLLDFAGGTARIYAALAEEKEPPAIKPGEEAIVFWRNDGQSFYRCVAEDERLAWMEAKRGKSFGDICTLLAFQGNGAGVTQRAAGFLSQWFADGLVTRLSLSD